MGSQMGQQSQQGGIGGLLNMFGQGGGGNWSQMGNILSGKLGSSTLLQGIGSKLMGTGMGKAVGGFLSGGTGQALMKGLGATGPAGLALMAGSKLLSAFGGAKKAKAESKRITGKMDEIVDAQGQAGDILEESDKMAKGEHLTAFKTAGRGASRGKSTVDLSSEQAYVQSGFEESGQVDYASEVSTKQIDEDFDTKKESLDKVLGQTLAANQEQFDSFNRQAEETLAGLRAAKGKLKTKWYQNLI